MEQNMICPFCGKAGGGELEMLLVSLVTSVQLSLSVY